MPRNIASEDYVPPRPLPAPWTASRCNRTLRQLNSFVRRLEKWHKDFLIFQEQSSCDDGEGREIPALGSGNLPQDLPWLSDNAHQREQRSRRGYGSRNKKSGPHTPAVKQREPLRLVQNTPRGKAHLPDVSLPKTPCCTSAGDTPNRGHTARKASSNPWTFQSRDLKIGVGGRNERGASLARRRDEVLRDGSIIIPSFLVATSDPELPSQWKGSRTDKAKEGERGAKSLVSMCLGRLSKDVVKEQEENDANHDGYDGQCDNVGLELQELEDYFGDSQLGWTPLRIFTRACAIEMVSRLIESGALPKETASDIAIRSFGSPLLADFGEAITEVLIQLDANSYPRTGRWNDIPAWKTIASYSFDDEDRWRQLMYFRWISQAIRLEDDPVPFISHCVRFQTLVKAFVGHLLSEQAAAAALIESTLYGLLGCEHQWPHEQLRHEVLDIVPDAKDHRRSLGPPKALSPELLNRSHMFLKLFIAFPTEANYQLLLRISKQAQRLVDSHYVLAISSNQQLLIGQIYFTMICLNIIGEKQRDITLQISFERLLHKAAVTEQMEAHLIPTLLSVRQDKIAFMGLIRAMLQTESADLPMLGILLERVCAEASMDYAAEQPEDDHSVRLWASTIEDNSHLRDKTCRPNPSTPHGSQGRRRTGYRWDQDVEEWIERTPKTVPDMVPQARAGQMRGGMRPCTDAALKKSESEDDNIKTMERGLKRRLFHYDDFEVHRDDDFEYRKPRRIVVGYAGLSDVDTESSIARAGRHRRRKPNQEEDSADELSFLE